MQRFKSKASNKKCRRKQKQNDSFHCLIEYILKPFVVIQVEKVGEDRKQNDSSTAGYDQEFGDNLIGRTVIRQHRKRKDRPYNKPVEVNHDRTHEVADGQPPSITQKSLDQPGFNRFNRTCLS